MIVDQDGSEHNIVAGYCVHDAELVTMHNRELTGQLDGKLVMKNN